MGMGGMGSYGYRNYMPSYGGGYGRRSRYGQPLMFLDGGDESFTPYPIP